MQSQQATAPSQLKIILAFAGIYIIWGSTYLGILLAMQSIPPFLMLATRFFVAGLLLLLWCIIQKKPFPSLRLLAKNSFAGMLMLFGGTGAVVYVEQYISSGLTAIIVAAAPIWFVLLDKRQWAFHFNNKRIVAGLLIGFVGVVLLFSDGAMFDFHSSTSLICIAVMLCGEILWVSGSLYTKYNIKEGQPMVNAAVQMLAAGIGLTIFGLLKGEYTPQIFTHATSQAISALLYLIIFGSLVAYLSYVWLLTVRTPSVVGTYALVNPAVAVFLGWLIADELITGRQLVALAVIISGIVLVNFTKIKKTQS